MHFNAIRENFRIYSIKIEVCDIDFNSIVIFHYVKHYSVLNFYYAVLFLQITDRFYIVYFAQINML